MKKFKFRQIRNGEKLKKGTVLTHVANQEDRIVVAKNSEGNGRVDVEFKAADGRAGCVYHNQYCSQYLVVSPAKPETPKQTIERLTAELAESVEKNKTDKKAFDERLAHVYKTNSDRVSYYENRIKDISGMYDAECNSRRAAEEKFADAQRTICAMKETIRQAGNAIAVSGAIAQVR